MTVAALPKLEAAQMPELARIDATLTGPRVVWHEMGRSRAGSRSRRENTFTNGDEAKARHFAWMLDTAQVVNMLTNWMRETLDAHRMGYGRRTVHGFYAEGYVPEAKEFLRALSHPQMTPERTGKGVGEKIIPFWAMVQPERKGPEMVEWLKGRELLALYAKRYHKNNST
jgi:hypothetical protein